MTKIEAARIIESFVDSEESLPSDRRYITRVEEHALRKAIKVLRRSAQNKPKEHEE